MKLNLKSPQDVMALIVRRKWWILIPFVALSCAAALVTYMLPKMYVSQSLILIQPRDVPSDLVRNLIAGSTEERLSAIKQTVLSRTNLVKVANEYESDLVDLQKLNMDDKVLKLQKQIVVNFMTDERVGNGQSSVSYFRISYQNQDARIAQKIAKKVTDLFLEQDNQTREKQVNGTTEFFSAEVDKLAVLLNASDTKLKELKARRRNELPTQLDSNLRSLEVVGSKRQSLSTDLLLQRQQLSQWEQRLGDTPEMIPKPAVPGPPPVLASLDPKIEDYRKKLAEKKALISKGDTESNPDVRLVNIQLERMAKDMTPEDLALAQKPEKPATAAGPSGPEMISNPAYKNLVNAMDNVRLTIKLTEGQIAKADQESDMYNKRIANTPQGELELADIERENIELNKRYQDMNGKLSESKLSESLESKQKGAQFVVLDSANLPMTSTKPQKYVLAGAGTVISLLIGIAFGIVVDVANQKMWTLSDVESLLGTTVLVEIPEIVTPSDIVASRRKRKKIAASLMAATAAYGVVLYFAYIYQGFVLRHLDPVIQRFYQ